ncbi:MAG: hypothetical protein ABI877_07615 [Gemmatimonadaceae bacterium]
MDTNAFIADVEGGREVMTALLRIPGIEVFEHTGQRLPDGRGKARASLTPAAAEQVTELGGIVRVVTTADERRRSAAHAERHTQGHEPVQLITVAGPGRILADLAARVSFAFPLYAVRHLGEGEWEIATEAGQDAIVALRKAGLVVEMLEEAETLAARRGEKG